MCRNRSRSNSKSMDKTKSSNTEKTKTRTRNRSRCRNRSISMNMNRPGVEGPQLSIRAAALGPDTVVVSYDVMGRAKVKDVQIFMAQDGDTQWKNVGLSKKKKYVVAMNLNPNTKYFFQAKAKQWKKIKAVVTHVVTPPS
ncbi:hypothetical protein PoB_007180100, partial [Plakobranchus ocellatus]